MSIIKDVDGFNKSLSDNYIVPLKIYDMDDVRIGHYVVDGGFFSAEGCSRKIEKELSDRTVELPVCFLNGGTVEVPLEEEFKDQIQLKFNLSIGKDIIRYVQKTILYSANYMQRSSVFRMWEPCIEGSDIQEGVSDKLIGKFPMEQVKEVNSQRQTLKQAYGVADEIALNEQMRLSIGLAVIRNRLDITNLIKAAEGSACGNCLEMGFVGLQYAKDRFPKEHVEIFDIDQGDHLFLVIGRQQDSDPADYKSWGCDAVVCDPWSGGCYPSSQIEKFLMDFSENRQLSGVTIPCVTVFDPSYQSLNLANI